jgi:Ser/Thr protein kinase RdoA (MazF antagonist)
LTRSPQPAAEEETLSGGNLSTVVRVGDSVRRPAGPWTPAVHALLDHLEKKGFERAPRARGLDEQGREILSFVPGEGVGATQPWPAWCWTDETVVEVGRMLRSYHDAVRDFEPPVDASWRLDARALGPGEIVCHNDVAPYNLVRGPDAVLSLIDWDVAGPGPPRDDVTFAARAFAPLHPDDICERLGFVRLEDRPRRLRLFLDAYGLTERAEFIDHVQARLAIATLRITRAADAGEPAFQNLIAKGLLEPVRASQEWITNHRDELEAALVD